LMMAQKKMSMLMVLVKSGKNKNLRNMIFYK